jgi:hypothetical protein
VIDELEEAIVSGAVAAFRRRAGLQRKVAEVHGDRSGEAAIAWRIAIALDQLADEFEREIGPWPIG